MNLEEWWQIDPPWTKTPISTICERLQHQINQHYGMVNNCDAASALAHSQVE
jgi:hypothetical protein